MLIKNTFKKRSDLSVYYILYFYYCYTTTTICYPTRCSLLIATSC